jgi:hypothetical protein
MKHAFTCANFHYGRHKKNSGTWSLFFYLKKTEGLALARFHARVLLVDHVQAAFAAHNAAVFITLFRGFEGAENFHNVILLS